MGRKRLGEVLREREQISSETLERAIHEQQGKTQEQQGKTVLLGELLLERGLVSKEALADALTQVTGLEYVDAGLEVPSPEALASVPRAVAERYCVLPLNLSGRKLKVLMAEPQDLGVLTELRFLCNREIAPCLGFRNEIREAVERCYEQAAAEPALLPGTQVLKGVNLDQVEFFSTGTSPRGKAAVEQFQEELRHDHTPAVQLVSSILYEAGLRKASDVHIEQHSEGTVVRVRIDGILQEMTQIPPALRAAVVSRIKVLADMDIAERRVSQDGRFLMRIGSMQLDLRVSTLPTQYGEKVVIRLLDSSAISAGFADLGLSPEDSAALSRVLAQPQGMLLVTGPTGSGKSTTLYTALTSLRSPSVNIVTIEDPIEYVLEGINQVQVNPQAGRTFAGSLRSMLRQDPNVIMVGEIRDSETAEVALQASQTGHLVLSTLHTNDSVAAITRLLDLKVPGFLVAASLTAVISQRLVRKLCPCRLEVPATPEYALHIDGSDGSSLKMFLRHGCEACGNTGYKGRVGIYEVLVMNEEIRGAVRNGKKDDEIRTLVSAGGGTMMQDDALRKVRMGITTLEEIMRVVPFEEMAAPRCRACQQSLAAIFSFCPYCGTHVERYAPVAHRRRLRVHGGAA